MKCTFADSEVDHNNKVQILSLFHNKKVSKLPKYIKELISLDNDIRNDKKLLKKLFADKIEYQRFVMGNVEWILEKT